MNIRRKAGDEAVDAFRRDTAVARDRDFVEQVAGAADGGIAAQRYARGTTENFGR